MLGPFGGHLTAPGVSGEPATVWSACSVAISPPRAWAVSVPTGQPVPQHFLDRLAKAGAPATTTNITADELWSATSAARLAFLRPGRHLSVSWRMIDHLAMGACTVFDHPPYPEWPVPLRAGDRIRIGKCVLQFGERQKRK